MTKNWYICFTKKSLLPLKLFCFSKSWSISPKTDPFHQTLIYFSKNWFVPTKTDAFSPKMLCSTKNWSIWQKSDPFKKNLIYSIKKQFIPPKPDPFLPKLIPLPKNWSFHLKLMSPNHFHQKLSKQIHICLTKKVINFSKLNASEQKLQISF